MGLAISRTIVEGHDGRIWLEQEESCGAAFHLELPLNDATQRAAEAVRLGEADQVPDASDIVAVQEV